MERANPAAVRTSKQSTGGGTLLLAQAVLGGALALIFVSVPLYAAIPFGHEALHHAVFGIGLALGGVLAAGRTRMRAVVGAGMLLLALLATRALAPGIANWSLHVAPLPSLGVLPLGVVGIAILFLVPVGAACAAIGHAMRAAGPAFYGGVVCGLVAAPIVALGVVGIGGTIAIAMVLVALAGVLASGSTAEVGVPRRSWMSSLVAASCGVALGVLSIPFESGAGGTAFASLFLPICVLPGVIAGSVMRALSSRRTETSFLVPLALAAVIVTFGAALPSTAEAVASSLRIAGTAGGNLPDWTTLHPLPALVAGMGVLLGITIIPSSMRDVPLCLLATHVGQLLPHGAAEIRLALLGCAAICLVAAMPRRSLSNVAPAATGIRLARTLAALAVLGFVGERGRHVIRAVRGERSIAGEIVRESSGVCYRLATGDPGSRDLRDGMPTPLEESLEGSTADPDAPVLRIVAQVLAHGEPPRRCLVLGRGAGALALALAELAEAEITIVTPSSGEAESLRRRCASHARVRIVAAVPRVHLAASRESFDRIVVASPQPPWEQYGLDHTSEFRAAIVAHLSPGGVAAQVFALCAAQPANMVSRFITDAMLDREESLLAVDHPRSANPWVAVLFGDGVRRVPFARFEARVSTLTGAVERFARAGLDARGMLQCCLADGMRYRLEDRLPTRNRDDRPWLAVSAHASVPADRSQAIASLVVLSRTRAAIESRIEFDGTDRDSIRSRLRGDYSASAAFTSWRADVAANCASDATESPATLAELDAMVLALAASPDLSWLRTPLLRAVAGLSRSGQRLEARLLLERLARAEREFALRRDANPGRDPILLRLAYGRFLARSGHRALALREFESLPTGEHAAVVDFETACLRAFGGRSSREEAVVALETALADTRLNAADRTRAEFALAYARRDRERLREMLAAVTPNLRDAAQRVIDGWLAP